MNPQVPSISESEWIVASEVWAEDGLTASEIGARLEGRAAWKQKTVNTFLTRLVGKGVLEARPEGRAFRYFALIPHDQCVRAESESFLKRVFGGAVAPMLAHFCETADLSDDEVERLRKILKRKEKSRREK
jgi:BlaI family penicillinase repressor